MESYEIKSIPVMSDNYVHCIHDATTGETACVDPAVAKPVLAALKKWGWRLSHILITHPHYDHVGGVEELKKATGCTVIGAAADGANIPGLDVGVGEGDVVRIGELNGQVLATPGHLAHDVSYWFADIKALFTGDALFSLGCGRVFGGTAEQLWRSMQKLRDLPDDALLYCAHEYTNANADFALSIDGDNLDLQRRADEVLRLRQQGLPTIPSRLADEKQCNPFLRADDPGLQSALGLNGQPSERVFAEIRRMKNNF